MGQMSSKFGEIIKKTIAVVKMSQAKPPSPTPQSNGGFWWCVFHVVEQKTPRKDAKNTPENHATKISGFRGDGWVTRGLI